MRVKGFVPSLHREDLSRLDYLTMCIKESMRLNTPVPFISRQLTGDLQIDGHTLPKDAFIDVNIFSLHHNRAVWGNDHMVIRYIQSSMSL